MTGKHIRIFLGFLVNRFHGLIKSHIFLSGFPVANNTFPGEDFLGGGKF